MLRGEKPEEADRENFLPPSQQQQQQKAEISDAAFLIFEKFAVLRVKVASFSGDFRDVAGESGSGYGQGLVPRAECKDFAQFFVGSVVKVYGGRCGENFSLEGDFSCGWTFQL